LGLGLILTVYGLALPGIRPPLTPEVNVNLYSGAAMALFGAVMLVLARRGRA